MLDHVIVTVSDFTRSIAFYAQVLKPLGITDFLDYKGQDGHPDLVPLRGHVQPNEGCTPRELNALKLHWCCPVKPLPAVWQVAADSFATGGNASLAQARSHD